MVEIGQILDEIGGPGQAAIPEPGRGELPAIEAGADALDGGMIGL